MKYKLVTASLLLALTAPAIADDDRPSTRIIEHLDQNGDGMITLDEFRGPRDGMFVHADINGDGAVTREEIKTHRDQMMAERQTQQADRSARQDARMEEMFTSMDINGDGVVTQEEARNAAFNRMDRDGDGVLSAEELKRPRHDKRHSGRHRQR